MHMKRVKFPLNMGEGIQVRTLEELQANFDFEKVTRYFLNGKLLIWLEDRRLINLKEQLSELSLADERYPETVCEILAVPYIDRFSYIWKKEKKSLEWLKENTDNTELLCRAYDLVYCDKKRVVYLDRDKKTVEFYRLEDMKCWILLENVCSEVYAPVDSQSICFLTECAGKVHPMAVNLVYQDNREMALSTEEDILYPIYNEEFIKDIEKVYLKYQSEDRPDASYISGYLVKREER